MKLGKKAKIEDIENPIRPKTGIPRKHTVCRITECSTIPMFEESHLDLQVDADEEPLFIMEMEYNIPKTERYRDHVYEMWFVDPKHKDFLLDIAQDYFFYIYHIDENSKSIKIEGKQAKREKEQLAIDNQE